MDTCPQCHFTYGTRPRAELAAAIGDGAMTLSGRLDGASDVASRRQPDEWSPLEYGCHVRDLLLIQRDRLYVALVEDEPSFKPMYRDHRAGFDRYGEQRPDVVAAQLAMAGAMTAHAFHGLSEVQWPRPLIYNFPEPTHRDVEWMAHHTLHEVVYHLGDVDRVLAAR
jgi:hypothetical protein